MTTPSQTQLEPMNIMTRKLRMRDSARDRSEVVEQTHVRARESHCSRYKIMGPKQAVLDHCAHLVQQDARPSKKLPKAVLSDPTRLLDADDGDEISITMKQNNWTGD